jgi:hypothetical protein
MEDSVIGDQRFVRVWAAAALLIAVALSISCGGSSNNPGPNPCDPALAITAGDGQTGEVMIELPDTLVVQATNCDPNNPQGPQLPEAGVSIRWAVTSGGGAVNGAADDTVVTDANGFARAVWLLGPTEGPQTISAIALRSTQDVVNFSATATAPAAGCPPGSQQHGGGVHNSDETWGPGGHVLTANVSFSGAATLTIQAGAHVCFEGGQIEITEQSHLDIQGTSANPVVIEAGLGGSFINFGVNIFALTTASTISNARLEGVGVESAGGLHPVVIESTLVRDGGILLSAPGSEFVLSTIVRGGITINSVSGGPITIEATVRDAPPLTQGIFINGQGGVTLTRCEVTGCPTGVHSAGNAAGVTIHSSNIFGNTGVGVNNGDAGTLDATGCWWGDPGGPNGPNGDGISGNVDFSGALSSPVILGYRPPE